MARPRSKGAPGRPLGSASPLGPMRGNPTDGTRSDHSHSYQAVAGHSGGPPGLSLGSRDDVVPLTDQLWYAHEIASYRTAHVDGITGCNHGVQLPPRCAARNAAKTLQNIFRNAFPRAAVPSITLVVHLRGRPNTRRLHRQDCKGFIAPGGSAGMIGLCSRAVPKADRGRQGGGALHPA